MQAIFGYFWQICLLRAGPEKIPSSITITGLMVGLFFLIQTISLFVTNPALVFYQVLGIVIIGFAVEATIIYGLLRFKNVSYRFLSTLTALMGSNSIFICILLLFNLLMLNLSDGWIADFVEVFALICFFWWLGVFGFILNRAIEISMIQGTVLAFIIELIVVLTTRSIFPPPG